MVAAFVHWSASSEIVAACRYELGTDEDGLEAARQGLTKLLPRFHVMLTTYEVNYTAELL